ncbi:conserved hypothetical protein [Sphingomonas sp. EC-HK361]|nr:conserved hypothetical protein [Sphingomonas sp. EC-HK361]
MVDEPSGSLPTGSALARKLDHHVRLNGDERATLDRCLGRSVRRLAARTALVEEGSTPSEMQVLLSGWACRYSQQPDGRRRIVAFYIPGDICDFDVFLMTAIDQSIASIGPALVAGLDRGAINELALTQPRTSQGLWWESLVSAAIQRAWTINVGHRSAKQRIAHLLCELHTRLAMVGMVDGGSCDFPLTQADIADACGLTSIHTNRALQEIRTLGLIALQDQRLDILHETALADLGRFNPAYLQIRSAQPPGPKSMIPIAV